MRFNALLPASRAAGQDWEAIHHSAADLEGTIEGFEAFVEEGRWVHANLQAYVHHEPVDPGFSNRDAARWLRLAQHLRTDFGKRVLHEAFAQRLQGN
ncbi:MAG TPA: hypothetical protein VHJ54_01830 [Solirubrobacterales bacterium]|jgi:hypothetical protein|nr:hypothetical protein [Solirubrobacterales bacterium]